MAPLFVFFFVLFLACLAVGYWITPFGPMMWGVAWLPLLFIILIVAALFSAPPPYQRKTANSEKVEATSAVAAVSIFIWILFFVFIVAIIAGHYR
mgnify:CR=1 FL=1